MHSGYKSTFLPFLRRHFFFAVVGMLELAGGRFENMENGVCKSGQVCALVGLKGVATGDTIMMIPEKRVSKKKGKKGDAVDDNLYVPSMYSLETYDDEQPAEVAASPVDVCFCRSKVAFRSGLPSASV